MADTNQRFLKLIENVIMGRVTVRARSQVHNFDQSIGPDDIRGFYENNVALKAESPEEREREAMLAFHLWNGGEGIISLYEAQRRAGIVNPLDEQNQMAAELLLQQMRPTQAEQLIAQLQQQVALPQNLAQAGSLTGNGLGNQFLPGLPQGPRPGERQIQQRRVASQAETSVFPEGQGGINLLGSLFSTPQGGSNRVPSGQTVGG